MCPSGIPFLVPLTFILFFSTTLAGTMSVIYFFLIMPEAVNRKQKNQAAELTRFLLPE
ncbi:MAG: hypothetical protein JRN10_07000 [Nitrososphaerota archaeon]|nr:hypothetical protein [Nitrososphaerota archaeon]MDG6930967.1 hypothetical protein [Nitrososphaerota archaeon]